MNLKKIIANVGEIYRPLYGAFAVMAIIITATQFLAMTIPFFYGKIVDGFVNRAPMAQMFMCAATMLGLTMIKHVFEFLNGYQHVSKIAFAVEERLAEYTLSKIMRLSLGQLLNQNSGFKVDIIKKGESSIIEMVEALLFDVVPMLTRTLVCTTGLFFLSGYLGIVTVVFVVVFVTVSFIINKKILPELRRQNKWGNNLGTSYWEIVKNLRLVIVNNQEKRAINEYIKEYHDFSLAGVKLWIGYFKMVTLMREPFHATGQFSVLMTGIYLLSLGEISPGNLVMAMAWSMAVFQSIGSVGSMQRRLTRYAVQIRRYFDLLEIEPVVKEVPNPIRPKSFSGKIEFQKVSFEYPVYLHRDLDLETSVPKIFDRDKHALKDVSFVIKPGTTCALVGPSGSGKSSIVNLILRGYDPNFGQILVDDYDLRNLHLGNWRRAIGIVEQDPKLWDNTLKYNMTFGLHGEEVGEPDLENIAATTRINEFRDRLGDKPFETQIGENGVQLSGGQRQRVAIARAIAKLPNIVILDEATNALDPDNERYIHEAIKDALLGRTGIIIAHRLSTIRHADQILVMEKGKLVGDGNHDSLMETCPTYRELVSRELSLLK